ncbi:MAG: hypothetical protein IJW48_01460 [Clostridia bacterium]|nr:hypothetical protein [Clostridia bacterium]
MCFAKSKELSKFIGKSAKQRLEYFDLYQFEYKEQNVNLYISHKRARKSTYIHCTESGDIIWEQLYPFGGMSRSAREKKYVLKPKCDKTAITVIVIRGKPGNIIGLDNGIFKSHLSASKTYNFYLMTEKVFRVFKLGIGKYEAD